MELAEQFRILLRRVADGAEPVEGVATWASGQRHALEALPEGPFKGAVQAALVHAWSLRQGHVSEGGARKSLAELIERLPADAGRGRRPGSGREDAA